MIKIIATMQTNYNGWTVQVEGADETESKRLVDVLEDTLPSVTYDVCDEDGCDADDVDEAAVKRSVAANVKREHILIIKYDEQSS